MRFSRLLAALLVLALSIPAFAKADPIRFGVPPWPGVTVKTEVVCQILEAMGHETTQLEVGPPIIYKGLTTGEVDAYVAAWLPQQTEMFAPLKAAGEIEVVATNLDEARTGLAVPVYVFDAGVTSIADLDTHAEKFDHTIYGIEVGAGMQVSTEEMIAKDVAGLGDWEQVSSTTPVMLSAVRERVANGQWVVFHGWEPHWMNIAIDMSFLKSVNGAENLVSQSVIYTVAAPDFAERFPQAHAFLKRFYVTGDTQSQWIYDFGYDKVDVEDVAHDWIAANMDTVRGWLDGVTAVDGRDAAAAVEASL